MQLGFHHLLQLDTIIRLLELCSSVFCNCAGPSSTTVLVHLLQLGLPIFHNCTGPSSATALVRLLHQWRHLAVLMDICWCWRIEMWQTSTPTQICYFHVCLPSDLPGSKWGISSLHATYTMSRQDELSEPWLCKVIYPWDGLLEV